MSSGLEARVRLRKRITCPHCWHDFPPENTHWVAEHHSLLGDDRLGDGEYLRFLPSRFNPLGNAIDPGGAICHELACPRCHLVVPRALLETAPLFISIVGAPACGKTYFLSAMIQQLRESLPRFFHVTIADADPQSNKVLNDYVEQQFFNPNRRQVVRLAKTEEQGDLYSSVMMGSRTVTLPMPFLFSLAPNPSHPCVVQRNKVARVLCMYDNAGESFLPGKDTGQNMVTRHLARSSALLFLFDPTQDVRFRAICKQSKDPQVTKGLVTSRQETLLHELAQRVRRHAGIGQNELHQKPLIVLLTKYDAWSDLLHDPPFAIPLMESQKLEGWHALDIAKIESTSAAIRKLMWKVSPEFVASAEAFSKRVLYLPASAFGAAPDEDGESGKFGMRPENINPIWCDVPILWTLSQRCEGLVPFGNTVQSREANTSAHSVSKQ